jgi:hypothetical protein
LPNIGIGQHLEDFLDAGDNVRLTPVASTEQYQAWFGRLSDGEEAG